MVMLITISRGVCKDPGEEGALFYVDLVERGWGQRELNGEGGLSSLSCKANSGDSSMEGVGG